jgi:Uma2 family endonuclease
MTDSSGGFYLRDGSMLSPDAAYILPETLGKITHQRPTVFYPTHPDFVIELLSPSDSLTEAQAKMETWLENGVQLGWLIVPSRKEVHIYQQGQPLRVFNGKTLTAPHPVEGFSLDLTRLWRYYES